ncbi:ABC transporter substrate-binding protein [Oculatella sp. FACHB-28]|uniref:CmpA/NrtA family ABC transporter substrate-binding protein n=1 Tax=Cyanophyceae TaxID=3028117 RepID=UPI001685850D|nr:MULTISPECIES: CmpA/NrtA family ABC transporter substrate-binding protein [Cyanophyceae]MBD2054993.1 ABC transporter substrate-binding protein [Oculatella sp. FACHB-28]MBD2068947.1 ABC transporter substrate-binding protein [Leptolyngbya sp. FACHB-671]
MTNFSNYSRRKFLFTAGVSAASSILLKGCLGNPPSATINSATAQQTPVAAIDPAQAPETTRITLGYIPIVESAPIVIAQQKGFFAKYGMTEVTVSKQSNWASARDNVVIGSGNGGIDGGQWQMPMPHLISEGLITNGQKLPMYVLAQLNTQGNGIAISGIHTGKGIGLDISNAAEYVKGFQATQGRKFKAAHTFPNVNQDFWIRYWFAAGGVDPDTDIDLLAVPSAETVQGMRTGSMDAFSTGDPWPYRIVSDDIGFMATLTAEMWPFHPEEYLAIRADWVDANPKATKAILKGIMEAQQWCDDPANRAELIQIVSGRNFFDVPANVLTPPYEGKYEMADGKAAIDDFKKSPLYWSDDIGSVSYPYKSHDLWFLTETMRWNFHNGAIADFDTARQIIDRVNREDLWKEAAQEAGFSGIPTSTSRGVETFFDGTKFDPENPEAYLNSLQIKRI